MIEFSSKVLAQIDSGYVVLPGHGPVANYQALADYVAMLTTIRERTRASRASSVGLLPPRPPSSR